MQGSKWGGGEDPEGGAQGVSSEKGLVVKPPTAAIFSPVGWGAGFVECEGL